jgi:hypothetical protein
MSPLDLFWHIVNGLAPALALGFLAPLFAKWTWRNGLRQKPYRVLATWAVAAAMLCTMVNALVLDRDGRLLGYAHLVLAVTAAVWWAGFGARSRRRG